MSSPVDPGDYHIDLPRGWDIDRMGEYSFERNPPAPDWLRRFIRDSVRPFLLDNPEAALRGWARWLERHNEQGRQREEWENRLQRRLFVLPEGPLDGYVWFLFNGVPVYGPRELSGKGPPAPELPLPPPGDRDFWDRAFSPDECLAALLAIDGAFRYGSERLEPAGSSDAERGTFEAVCVRARKLTEDQLPELRRMLRTASNSVNPTPSGGTNGEAGAGEEPPPRKPKRSTNQGEARAKIISALTLHHKYADGGCLNAEPIGVNELAEKAEVSSSTVSEFFTKQLGGHATYRNFYCGEMPRLVMVLKMLNGEYSPDLLFGGTPPGEE
jgi:hypothetical protein